MEKQNKLEEIMKYMETFLDLHEEDSWLENASTDDIDNAFKLASVLEKIYSDLQHTDSFDIVQRIIITSWRKKGRGSPSELGIFEEACDLQLTSCFGCGKLKLEILQHALCVYEKKCGQERLRELLTNLLKDSVACKVLIFFMSNSSQKPSLSTVLNIAWHNMIECGRVNYVREAAISALEHDCNSICVILEILVKTDPEEQYHSLKKILVEVVVSEMRKDIQLSSTLCSYIVNHTDFSTLDIMAQNYPVFLSVLLNGLESLVSKMKLECKLELEHVHYAWSDSTIPLNVIKHLCSCEGIVASRVTEWLSELQKRPGCSLWEDVAAYCT